MANNLNDSSGLQQVKPWYSALSSLHINPNHASSNKISPLISAKRISSSLSVKKIPLITATSNTPISTSPSITHILKRMTRTPTLSRPNSSNVSKISNKKRGQHHSQQNDEGVRIYMKSPHAIANGQLSGTIVLRSPLDNNFSSIQLSLTGTEEVIKPGDHYGTTNHHQFLNLEVFSMAADEIKSPSIITQNKDSDVVEIPFSVSLSPHLYGSFEDSELGSIKYNLKSEIKYNNDKKPSVTKTPVLIYPNFTSESLNPPITENNIQVWKSSSASSFVTMDLSLSRSIWTSGAPIYVTVNIHNDSVHTISDLKLELLRKQNTFCMGEGDSLIPIISACKTISETSLSNSGWWYPLSPNKQDHLTVAIEAPLNHTSVINQNLISISYFVRMLISSKDRTDIVAELPIILAHPISMNPPPSLLSTSNDWNESRYMKNLPRITLRDDIVVNKQDVNDDMDRIETARDGNDLRVYIMDGSPRSTLSDIIEVDTPLSDSSFNCPLSAAYSPSSDKGTLKIKTANNSFNFDLESKSGNNQLLVSTPKSVLSPTSIASSLHSTKNLDTNQPHVLDDNNQFRPLRRSNTTSSNKLNKMKRSFSTWGSLISRKMSISKTNKRGNRSSSRPEISSPIISNHSISSCSDSVASSLRSSPESSKNHDIISIIHRNSREFQPQRSIMKFGQIKGPKRFGQQPGSLGDAGLDIRKCFNVATATEAIKSFSAEKVEIPDDIPFYSCSSSSSCGDDEDDDTEELNDEQSPSEAQFADYLPYLEPVPLSENNFKWKEGFVAPPEKCQLDMSMIDTIEDGTDGRRRSSISKYPGATKRMLASSRHLMNLQKQVPKSGRHLVLPPSSV